MAERDKLRSLLWESIRGYADTAGVRIEIQDDLRLLGRGAPFDSLGFVMVLSSFEAGINDAFGTEIVLANERAMSMEHSPFRTVSCLVDYAGSLLDEQGKGQ